MYLTNHKTVQPHSHRHMWIVPDVIGGPQAVALADYCYVRVRERTLFASLLRQISSSIHCGHHTLLSLFSAHAGRLGVYK